MTKLEQIRNLDDKTLIDIVSRNICVSKDGKIAPCEVSGDSKTWADCSNCIFSVQGKSCTEICKRWLKAEPKGIQIGDIVSITDIGKLYTTYPEWVAKNIENIVDIARYAYGSNNVHKDDIFKVLQIAPHGMSSDTLAYITRTLITSANVFTFECYLISITGLKKVGE